MQMSDAVRRRQREFIRNLQEERSILLGGFRKPEKKEVTQKRIRRQVELRFKDRDADL